MKEHLKIYCHLRDDADDESQPRECAEVAIQSTPSTLREIAAFLNRCADRMEAGSLEPLAHFHLQDEWKAWDSVYPDVIAVSPPSSDRGSESN